MLMSYNHVGDVWIRFNQVALRIYLTINKIVNSRSEVVFLADRIIIITYICYILPYLESSISSNLFPNWTEIKILVVQQIMSSIWQFPEIPDWDNFKTTN